VADKVRASPVAGGNKRGRAAAVTAVTAMSESRSDPVRVNPIYA
jgi:hypothetical protein